MNERLPYRDMRKLALLAREKIGQKRLLTETDREIHAVLLRAPKRLIRKTQHLQSLARVLSSRYQHDDEAVKKLLAAFERADFELVPVTESGPRLQRRNDEFQTAPNVRQNPAAKENARCPFALTLRWAVASVPPPAYLFVPKPK
jgi:hypothetical protein